MEPGEGIVFLDFQTRFPHRYWYTSWGRDEDHAHEIRYKLMSTRGAPQGPIELVVLLEESGGSITEVNRVELSPGNFEKTAAIYVDGIGESARLTFFAVDLVRCQSAAEYERILGDAGWFDKRP